MNATILEPIEKAGTSLYSITVLLTDGSGFKDVRSFIVSDEEDAKRQINASITHAQKPVPLKAGPLDLTPPDPKPPSPPTQAELNRQAFFTDYDTERTDQILTTLTPALAARYKPEYGALR